MIKKYYDILDITKFVLSFFIVAIHTEGLPDFLYPWLRIAVPCFFVISSFLFFSKINLSEKCDGKKLLSNYLKRNLVLYSVWFVLLLPFTVMERMDWFNDGVVTGILRFFRALFLGSTFRASWYIMASVIAVVIIYYLSKRINNYILFIIGLISYSLCCLVTSYLRLIENNSFYIIYEVSKYIFDGIATSFIYALVWVIIGKMFADNKLRFSVPISVIGCVLTLVALFYEHRLVVGNLNASNSTSCYFMLIPLVTFIFSLLIKLDVNFKFSSLLRNLSTLIYVSHCAVISVYSFIFSHLFGENKSILIYLCTGISITIVGTLLVFLSKNKRLKFLSKLW